MRLFEKFWSLRCFRVRELMGRRVKRLEEF